MNKPLNCGGISPLCNAACTEEDLVEIMRNYTDINYTDRRFIPMKDVKVIRRGYTWNHANSVMGVNSQKTFAYQYLINDTNSRVEVYYRHYEYTPNIEAKLQRRIERARTTTRVPFFILQFSPDMCKCTSFAQRLVSMLSFTKSQYPYKLIITHEDLSYTKFKCLNDAEYVFHTSLLHDELIKPFFEHIAKNFPLLDADKLLKELSNGR